MHTYIYMYIYIHIYTWKEPGSDASRRSTSSIFSPRMGSMTAKRATAAHSSSAARAAASTGAAASPRSSYTREKRFEIQICIDR